MTVNRLFKLSSALLLLASISVTVSAADSPLSKDRSKYKYGYVISHKEGSTQAHLESRNGNLALGRYYVNLPNGSGQKVTYFADDLGFHTGVSYSSRNGKGSSKTQIAMGHKALAALGSSNVQEFETTVSSTSRPLFGAKIGKIVSEVTSKPSTLPKLNYTPVPGGFILTHESIQEQQANETAKQSEYTADSPSQTISSQGAKLPNEVFQIKGNPQTTYETSENVINDIREHDIISTTQSYPTVTQQTLTGTTDGSISLPDGNQNEQRQHYDTALDNLSYLKQKSIEKTQFADIDARIISEVQKHAEQIIMKDLQNEQNVLRSQNEYSTVVPKLTTVTMQPIVVTNNGETGINNFIESTQAPDVRKFNKNFQPETINSVKELEKINKDQLLEDSAYFRVSLSPSFSSSVNVSQTPQQLINEQTGNEGSESNNSTLCDLNLCENGNNQLYVSDLDGEKPKVSQSDSLQSDTSITSNTNKIPQVFYPQNKLTQESHYITTIDVQKGISLDVQQNEDGSIQLASNFPYNKLPQYQKQYNRPTPQPIVSNTVSNAVSNAVSVTPNLFSQAPNVPVFSTPQKPYVVNAVTLAPGLFDVTPNENLAILQGLNSVAANPNYSPDLQERIENNGLGYENQVASPVLQGNLQSNPNIIQEDFTQVEKNIQQLRQQIFADIDAQHEEEQRKQKLVDEERKEYFENLKKVEALKGQNSISYSFETEGSTQASGPAVAAPEVTNNVELVPQTQYVQNSPAISYRTELKDFTHQIPVVYSNNEETRLQEVYPKQEVAYEPQDHQRPSENQYNVYPGQNINAYVSNNVQSAVSAYAPQQLSTFAQQVTPPIALQPRYSVENLKQVQQLGVLPGHFNTLSVSQSLLPENKISQVGKTFIANPVVPFAFHRELQTKQNPISLLQTYPLSFQTESPLTVSSLYPVSQLPYQIPQSFDLSQIVGQQETGTGPTKQYHATLTQKATNKLRVQPLKPSLPDEESQREQIRNLLSQPQFRPTYYYHGLPFNNRLQLRHIRKNQISNSDQVRSQSIRRGKSLKNLRIEYGFKPPLRPSVEFTEEVKPSIYGPSVPPQ